MLIFLDSHFPTPQNGQHHNEVGPIDGVTPPPEDPTISSSLSIIWLPPAAEAVRLFSGSDFEMGRRK